MRQTGATLIITLVGLLAMTMAAMSIVRSVDTANLIAGNLGFHQAAIQSTELGIETAIPVLEGIIITSAGDTTTDNPLQNYYASYSGNELPPPTRLSTSTGNSVTDPGTSNTVRYVIERMCNDTNAPTMTNCLMEGTEPLYRITTLVAGPRNTSANMQVYVIGESWFNPDCAVTAQSDIDISGIANITGDGNCVHSNDDMNIVTDPIAIGEVRAVNSVGNIATNIGAAGGTWALPQASVTLPEINPSDFEIYADYKFKTDGTILDSVGGIVGPPWNGWSRTGTGTVPDPYIWAKSGGSPADSGLYYFEDNVDVSDGVGDVSFISTGSIKITGNSNFQNYENLTPGFPPGVNNIFMMTGGDLEYIGNSAVTVEGIIAVGEEIKINGNPDLDGYFIVKNATNPDLAGMNLSDNNEFLANFSLEFDSSVSLISPWSQPTQRLVWRTLGQ